MVITGSATMRLLLRFFGFLFAFGTIVFLLGVGATAALVWHFSQDLPDYSQLKDYEPPIMTRVHAADGALIGEYAKERRLYMPIQAIPKGVIDAFLAAEDKNFYDHGGLDFTGIARAGWTYLQNFGSNRRPQGASTITQQVAKNFLLTNEVSLRPQGQGSAAGDAHRARLFQGQDPRTLSQRDLSRPRRLWRCRRSSLVYFDKSVNELTIADAAYLAALPKAPATLHPVRNRDRAVERRNYVVDRLQENGWITAEEGDKARKQPLNVTSRNIGTHVFAVRILRRGSPPRRPRTLRREEAL